MLKLKLMPAPDKCWGYILSVQERYQAGASYFACRVPHRASTANFASLVCGYESSAFGRVLVERASCKTLEFCVYAKLLLFLHIIFFMS